MTTTDSLQNQIEALRSLVVVLAIELSRADPKLRAELFLRLENAKELAELAKPPRIGLVAEIERLQEVLPQKGLN